MLFENSKLQGPAPKHKNNFKNIPFLTIFHENTNNRITIKIIKRKIEYTASDYLEGIFQ